MTKSSDPDSSDSVTAPVAQSPHADHKHGQNSGQISCCMASAEATAELAQWLGQHLHPGDTLLLEGPIGAGKTHFARSLIQSLMLHPEDVPSPTFTLVQTYDLPVGELWHADLYRLSAIEEVEELGLFEAFDDAICLIEWPDRLGALSPVHALHLTLALDPTEEDCRHLTLQWQDPKWQSRMDEISHDRS